jgi:hypothetical protein
MLGQLGGVELMRSFQAGQYWKYRTRGGEESSRILVLAVDEIAKFGEVVHVAVINLQMINPKSATGFAKWIGHLPITNAALNKSVTELDIELFVPPDFDRCGYTEWRSAFKDGQGGVWNASVSEIVQVIEDGLKCGPLCVAKTNHLAFSTPSPSLPEG